MAISSFRNPTFSSSLGSALGTGLGVGLGSGLQALAEARMQRLNQQEAQTQRNAFSRTLQDLGFSPAEATFVSQLPANQQFEAFRLLSKGRSPSEFAPQSSAEESPFVAQEEPRRSGLVDLFEQMPVQTPGILQNPVEFNPAQVRTQVAQEIAPPTPRPQPKKKAPAKQAPKPQQQITPAPIKFAPAVQPAIQEPLAITPQVQPAAKTPRETEVATPKEVKQSDATQEKIVPYKPAGVKKVPTELTKTSKAIEDGKTLTAKELKEERAEQHKTNKETQKYYDQILAEDKAAINGDARLNRMESLIDQGKLPNNTFYNLVEGIRNLEIKGVPIIGGLVNAVLSVATGPIGGGLRAVEVTQSPGTEEFEKLSADFVKDAKNYFGGRLTDADLKAFMQTVPTLAQSDIGKRALIRNMRTLNQMARVRANSMKEIIRERGYRPSDLALLVEERAKPKIDELSAEFIKPTKEIEANPELLNNLSSAERRQRAGAPNWDNFLF